MGDIPLPSGSLAERLSAVAALHERNAVLCGPGMSMGPAAMKVAARHVAIHEQAARDIREAVSVITGGPANG